MSNRVTLGGDRVGSGKKMQVEMHGFNRSNHDMSRVFRSSMAQGTLVPFYVKVALPGDTWDIKLRAEVLTHPTIGPMYGSSKVQLDVYQAPMRLYQGKLHNNTLGVGMRMATIKIPQVRLWASKPDFNKVIDNQQMNSSCIFKYLGISGIGDTESTTAFRDFNAIPWLAYWDIYKNYYANKQEKIGAVIHTTWEAVEQNVATVEVGLNPDATKSVPAYPINYQIAIGRSTNVYLTLNSLQDPSEVYMNILYQKSGVTEALALTDIWSEFTLDGSLMTGKGLKITDRIIIQNWRYVSATDQRTVIPQVKTFPLENIDRMREDILQAVKQTSAFTIQVNEGDTNDFAPYSSVLQRKNNLYATLQSQEGLALKTYQSDLFNNWLAEDWIGGTTGVSAVTAVDTTSGEFTMDTLNFKQKLYNMMNRIAVSGGSYDDFIEATYDHKGFRKAETPIYEGGMSKELIFQEVIATAASESNGVETPLGQLGGRGRLADGQKGGTIRISVDEYSYIIGIVSVTPRIDYSQGNEWDVNLKTFDDFHKPGLDEIGFQDLITEQMAWWDTRVGSAGAIALRTAGKQPAWVNYQTDVNKTFGSFAEPSNEMFMTWNRRYEPVDGGGTASNIKDLSTYIDPAKYNNVWADEARDAQNLWVQIGIDATARRKMSARLMPNL